MGFIGHLRGNSCWKLLFQAPDNIQGLRSNHQVLSVGQILALSIKYPLHDANRFTATYTRDIDGLALYHVEEKADGATPKELLASLDTKNLLGARTSSSDEAIGSAIWWRGTDDDILVMAWEPMILRRPPRNVPECERLARLSARFCYLAIIFAPDEVLDDIRLFGTTISASELYLKAEERGKLNLNVRIAHNPDGTSHIVLDAEGLPLRAVLAREDGDIEMM